MEPCFSSLQQGERSSSWGCSMRVQGKEGSASGAAPGLDMFVSKDFIGTKHPPASLSLFTNKEWYKAPRPSDFSSPNPQKNVPDFRRAWGGGVDGDAVLLALLPR